MPSFRRNPHGVFKINGIGALKSAKSLALGDFGVWNGVAGGLDATGSLRSGLVRTCGPFAVAVAVAVAVAARSLQLDILALFASLRPP